MAKTAGTRPVSPAGIAASRIKAATVIDVALATTDGKITDTVAKAAGYADRSGAWKAVMELVDQVESAAAEVYRGQHNGQIDQLLPVAFRRVFEAWLEGDDVKIARLTGAYVRLLERHSRLNGLDLTADDETPIGDEITEAIKHYATVLAARANGAPVPQE